MTEKVSTGTTGLWIMQLKACAPGDVMEALLALHMTCPYWLARLASRAICLREAEFTRLSPGPVMAATEYLDFLLESPGFGCCGWGDSMASLIEKRPDQCSTSLYLRRQNDSK